MKVKIFEVQCTDGTWQQVDGFQAAAYSSSGAPTRQREVQKCHRCGDIEEKPTDTHCTTCGEPFKE